MLWKLTVKLILLLSHTLLAKKLIEITSENDTETLQRKKFCFVLFYAPWEERCQATLHLMEKVADHLKSQDDILIAIADIYSDRKLGMKYRVDDFCNLIFFIKGSVVPEKYKEPVTYDHLLRFIQVSSLMEVTPNIFKQPLIHLNNHNFDRIVKDKDRNVMVFFHTVWCEKCKKLLPVVEQVGKNFQSEPQCVVSEIDGQKSFDAATENYVGVYPTFRFYSKSDKDGIDIAPGKYDENWSEQNLTQLLNRKCGTERITGGFLDKSAGRYDELDVLARYFMRNSPKRERAIREAVEVIQKMPPYKKAKADYYVKVMENILLTGDSFLGDEIARITNVLQSDISLDQKDDFTRRRNVLQHFQRNKRDEL